MLTAYGLVTHARMSLFSAQTALQISEHSKSAVRNWLENQSIWKELNHYKKTGTILGKHRLFSHFKKVQEIKAKSIGELYRLKVQLEDNIDQTKRRIRKDSVNTNNGQRQERVIRMIQELKEVNQLLNL